MTIYGYARVSTAAQELEAQIQQLEKNGATVIYQEKFTGTKTDRPELNRLLRILQEGDTLMVTKLDRIARSATQGSELVKNLITKGIKVHILNMGLLDNTPASKLIRNIFFAFAEFERDMIVERTQEGKAIARQNPNYREGRKPTYTKKQLDHAIGLLKNNSYNQVVDLTGISKSTLIREVKKRKENNNIDSVIKTVRELKEISSIKVTEGSGKSSDDKVNVKGSSKKNGTTENKPKTQVTQNYELQEHHYDRFCNECGESVAADAEECGYCGSDSFDVMDLNDL